jgi:hypothetical protein
LERLERRCQWLRREAWLWRIGGLCAVAAVITLCALNKHWFGAPPRDARFGVVDAKSFQISDAARAPRVQIGSGDGSTPQVVLVSENGKARVGILTIKDGNTGLFITDNNGTTRIRLLVDERGQPSIEFRDEKNQVIASHPPIPVKQ